MDNAYTRRDSNWPTSPSPSVTAGNDPTYSPMTIPNPNPAMNLSILTPDAISHHSMAAHVTPVGGGLSPFTGASAPNCRPVERQRNGFDKTSVFTRAGGRKEHPMSNDRDCGKDRFKRRADLALAALVTAVLLSGCATSGPAGVGFSAQPLAANRYMVTVAGTNARENSLVRRAAEVTVQAGYTHFTLGPENIESRTYYRFIGDTFLHGPHYGRRAGLWPEYPNWPETYYSASAEVVLLRPDEAAGNPQAIEARPLL